MFKIAEKLEKYLQEYDKILVLGSRCHVNEISFHIASRQTADKILLLVIGWEPDKSISGATIQAITYEEYRSIEKLYRMYEYSNRIHIVTDSEQYGCLGNYVSNGLLTEEEALIALLR